MNNLTADDLYHYVCKKFFPTEWQWKKFFDEIDALKKELQDYGICDLDDDQPSKLFRRETTITRFNFLRSGAL